MHHFAWLGSGILPSSADLRRRGWMLHDQPPGGWERACGPPDETLLLMDGGALPRMRWLMSEEPACRRRWALVLGVADPARRARLLAQGVGDAVGTDALLAEVEARAARIVGLGDVIPRYRTHGGLRLDLLDRDGFVANKPLGLHPREFALLWRLLESPGEMVDKTALLRDVWRLSHKPETNSIAVHASRLRAKLAFVGLGGLVQTAPSGAYFVQPLAAGSIAVLPHEAVV